jgi:hypothetical protein
MKTHPIACCEHLRGKTMYYREDERPGLMRDSDAITHYCLKTMEITGPDEAVARPTRCQPGRPCYERES